MPAQPSLLERPEECAGWLLNDLDNSRPTNNDLATEFAVVRGIGWHRGDDRAARRTRVESRSRHDLFKVYRPTLR
ncbi:MAG: hypothetical protein ACKV2Q_29325 [Planctomycetaceae bacterium]